MAMNQQAAQVSVTEAIQEAPGQTQRLQALAATHRAEHHVIDSAHTKRHWVADAGTHCYQTHIAISNQSADTLDWLADVFYRAASLVTQPWYEQFRHGVSDTLSASPLPGIDKHQLCCGSFDVGLGKPRYYRQLVSLCRAEPHTVVINARSIDAGPELADAGMLAFTLAPNGEVLHYADGMIHWHHICCTPGPSLLPLPMDRWLMNTLRIFGVDSTERATYRHEAEGLRDWLQSDHPHDAIQYKA